MIKNLTKSSIVLLIITISGCSSIYSSKDNKIAEIQDECKIQFSHSDYDSIRGKIELYPTTGGPNDLLENSRKRISKEEKPAMKKFISLFKTCNSESANALYVQYPVLGMRSIQQGNLEISLLEKLYYGDITWGEFTERRYNIMNNRANFETQRAEKEVHDHQQEQKRQFQNQINDHLKRQEQQKIELNKNRPTNTTTRCIPTSYGQIQCESTTW